jgi:hypothetical protein
MCSKPMQHLGPIIHHVCKQLVNGEAKGLFFSWCCPSTRVVKVRLTNLICIHCLKRGYISQAKYISICVAKEPNTQSWQKFRLM